MRGKQPGIPLLTDSFQQIRPHLRHDDMDTFCDHLISWRSHCGSYQQTLPSIRPSRTDCAIRSKTQHRRNIWAAWCQARIVLSWIMLLLLTSHLHISGALPLRQKRDESFDAVVSWYACDIMSPLKMNAMVAALYSLLTAKHDSSSICTHRTNASRSDDNNHAAFFVSPPRCTCSVYVVNII